MADDIARLAIKIEADDIQKGTKALDKLGKEAKEAETTTKKLGKTAKLAFAGLAGFVTGAFGKAVLDTNLEFDKLNASLVTITGSAEDAETAFEGIKEFATKTPFDVQQVTAAFIKLGALGLSPSERALASYGNTASAMGKDLNQMIEAVADATTGEFERLKEFGIKAKSQGDNVSFTFAGVTKTVGKNAEEIQNYLLDLGESKFGDAMALQVETLGGSISNLGVAWDNFLDKVLSSKTSSAIGSYLDRISGGINAVTNGLTDQTKIAVKIVDEMEELDELLDKQRNAGKGLFNFDEASDFNTEIAYQKVLIAGLQKEYDSLTKQDNGKTFEEIAEGMDKVSGSSSEMSAALTKSLKAAAKEALKTKADFKSLFDDITKPATQEDSDVKLFEVNFAALQAQSAISAGDFGGAIDKTKQAFELLEQMKNAGNVSDSILEFTAANLKKIGEEAADGNELKIKTEIDLENAKANMTDAQKAMQEQADANPIKQQIIFEFGQGNIDFGKINPEIAPNTATSVPKQPQLQPAIITLPSGGSHTVYGDPETIDSFAAEIAREATKRGTR